MITDTKAAAPRSLVINRAKWLRGEGPDASKLLRPRDGRMCCLGFLGLSLGLTREHLNGIMAPDRIPGLWPEWLHGGPGATKCTLEAYELMRTNDDPDLTPDAREQKVAAIFAKHGVTVTFIDGDSQ